MSKYIIEVDDNAVGGLFKVKGFAMAFDKDGLDKLQKYEEPEPVREEQSWPQSGDKYYFITAGGVIDYDIYYGDSVDEALMEIGNSFKTYEEARFAVERLKVLAEMRTFAEPSDVKWDGNTYHYYIYYYVENKCVDVYQNSLMRCGEFYFKSKERARECIEAVGEDRIKKFYLGVE